MKYLYLTIIRIFIIVLAFVSFSNAQVPPEELRPIKEKLYKIKGDTVSTEACDLIMEGFRIIRGESIKKFKKDKKNRKNPENIRKAEEAWDGIFDDIDGLCKKYMEMKATVRRLCTKLRVTYMPSPC